MLEYCTQALLERKIEDRHSQGRTRTMSDDVDGEDL